MYYQCRKCKDEEFRGILPGVTCGILLLTWGAVFLAFLVIVAKKLFPGGLGWWWLAAAPVMVLLAWIPGALLLHLTAMAFEWAMISVSPCRKCGSHRFSFGKTHGFGL
jgi:hypothetical protein